MSSSWPSMIDKVWSVVIVGSLTFCVDEENGIMKDETAEEKSP